MKPLRAGRLAGWASVLAMLLLSSPGVRIVKADPAPDGPVAEAAPTRRAEPSWVPPDGPACSEESIGSAVLSVALPSEAEFARRARERVRPTVVPLGGGGEGYGRAELPRVAPR